MAGKRGLWNKVGRYLTGVIVLCFFLPFFGISCDGMDVVTISGADMVGGCKPGGLIAAMEEESQHTGTVGAGGESKVEAKLERVERQPLAIAALAVAVLAFGLSWVRTRRALLASCLLAVVGLGTLAGLYVTVGGKLDKGVELGGLEGGDPGGAGAAAASEIRKDVKVESGPRMGLWVVGLGLLGVAALTGLALREPDGPASEPVNTDRATPA